MKKEAKDKCDFFEKKLNLVVDERLTALQGKILAPKKLAEANKRLSKMKSLPK